jgi:hypothetical protein
MSSALVMDAIPLSINGMDGLCPLANFTNLTQSDGLKELWVFPPSRQWNVESAKSKVKAKAKEPKGVGRKRHKDSRK